MRHGSCERAGASAQWPRIAALFVMLALAALVVVVSSNGDWGKPLGPGYAGPEGRPRAVSASPTLGSDELATIGVFEKASRSVVFIVNSAIQRDFFSLNPVEAPQGSGSGFIWDQMGHVVTNFHVVYGADAITVVLGEKSEYEARLVGVDPDHDLAVLRIQAPKDTLVPIPIGSARDLRVGQKVLDGIALGVTGKFLLVGLEEDRLRNRLSDERGGMMASIL